MMDAAQRVGRSGWVHRRPAGMAAGAAAVLVLLAAAAAPGQTVLRVRAGAAPGGNGSSWPAAFADLQSALTAAGPIAGGGGSVEIWVATGTYLPTLRTDAADPKSVTFQLASRVAILGGFSGTETLRGERSPDTNPTILSGDLNGDDTADDSHRWENATHVVTGIGVDGSAVLDGVTVTSGFSVPGVSYRDASGAGLRLINSSPSIIGCTIRQNWIRYYALGAGVYIAGTPGVATFQNCVFDQNRTNSQGAGAAMWLDSGTVLATGCTVTNNYGGDVARKGG